MIMEVYCKTALSKSKIPGIDYSLNPYIGCQHACIYCYVPSMFNIDFNEWKKPKVKKNIPNVLMKELRKKKRGIVGISTSTDAYQPLELKYEITRKCLNLLLKHGWSIDILTKSKNVLRDLQIIKKFDSAKVGVTITTFSNEKWEGGSKAEERLEAIKKFANEEIFTYIFFGPIFPLMSDEEIEYCIEEFISSNVDAIVMDKLHLKKGLLNRLKNAYPDEFNEMKKALLGNFYERAFKKVFEIARGRIKVIKAWD